MLYSQVLQELGWELHGITKHRISYNSYFKLEVFRPDFKYHKAALSLISLMVTLTRFPPTSSRGDFVLFNAWL